MSATGAPGTPSAITMWDFSWLLRRHGSEAEYVDLDRVLDELKDRGYDSVRIDAFPHWVAADRDGRTAHTITALPQQETFMWGNHAPVDVQPEQELLRFLDGLRRRGLRAGLSTWLTADQEGRSMQVQRPQDLARVWIETLAVIDQAGYLDVVDYVDLCNEWPLFTPGPRTAIWPDGPPDEGTPDPWTDGEIDRIDRYGSAVSAVKARFPQLPTLFSYCLRGAQPAAADDCMRLSTSSYDLAEVHLWLTSTPDFADSTAQGTAAASWENLERHQQLVQQTYWTARDRWLGDLDELMRRWKQWADERNLPLWTTECWASVFWNPELSTQADPWAYVRDVAEHAVPLAVERGWAGVATSNFSQPHHRGLWADADWHRRLTGVIHAGSRSTGHPTPKTSLQ